MRNLTATGSFICLIGLLVLVINVFGDSGTPTLSHVDTLGLGMAISGAILALGPRE